MAIKHHKTVHMNAEISLILKAIKLQISEILSQPKFASASTTNRPNMMLKQTY